MTSPCIRRYRMWRSVLLVLALALACFLMTVHGYSDVATVGDVASAGSVSSETTPPPTTPTPTTVTPPPTTRTPPPTTREPTTTPPPPPPPTTTPPPPSTTAPPPTTTSPPSTTTPPTTTTPAPPPPTTTEPAEAGIPTVAPTTAPSTTPAPLTATPTTTTPPTTLSPTTKPTSTPTRTHNGSASGLTGDNRTVDTTKSSHATSSGKYAIIIAVVLVVAVVLLASIYVFRRHRSKKDETAAELRRQLDQIDMEMGQGVYTKAQAPDAGLAVAVVPANNSGSGSGGRRSYPSQKPQQSPASWSSSRATAASDRDRDSLSGVWKDPEVLAARIPYEKLRFGELLSRGGFGEVFAGEYHDQRVAIKRLLPENRRRMAALEDFLKEAQLLTALEHERIVALVGVAWDSPRDLCLVLEFMPNGDLRNLLAEWRQENRPTGWADVRKLRIALHVAEALTYLHTLAPKIVHRDLKSKNVLIDDQWQAKLSDFGISRKESTHNTMTTNVGSSLWIAPEVMMGNNYDEKADIYSFGIVLTELDSLQLPYHNATSPDGRKMPDAAVLHLVTMGKLQAEFSAMSRTDIVLVGRSCLAMDPAQRPSAAELRYRLSQILGSY